MDTGDLHLEPAVPLQGDLYRGHIAVRTTEKVELTAAEVGSSLRPGDARNINRMFGAGDLSGAAFTYRSSAADYTLALKARRHASADLLEADVSQVTVTTVVNTRGQTINRVQMDLRVGSKRHLRARLPVNAKTWSLMVNNRAVQPSLTGDGNGKQLLLIPLLASAVGSGERAVHVDLIYVSAASSDWDIYKQSYAGPRFDLPLRNVRWVFYMPEGFDYDDFEGTMTLVEDTLELQQVSHYDINTYNDRLRSNIVQGNRQVKRMQEMSRNLQKKGEQQEAKQVLVDAFNNPYQAFDLNEDIRQELQNLNKQQAMVGLKGRRFYIRPNAPEGVGQGQGQAAGDLGGKFTQEQAQRELNALDKADSDNLEVISTRIINTQDAAAGAAVPLTIQLPERGVVIELTRSLQVKPDSAMVVTCYADPTPGRFPGAGIVSAVGIFAVALMLILFGTKVADKVVSVSPRRKAQDQEQEQEQEVSEE
jgi:hypothetical protein